MRALQPSSCYIASQRQARPSRHSQHHAEHAEQQYLRQAPSSRCGAAAQNRTGSPDCICLLPARQDLLGGEDRPGNLLVGGRAGRKPLLHPAADAPPEKQCHGRSQHGGQRNAVQQRPAAGFGDAEDAQKRQQKQRKPGKQLVPQRGWTRGMARTQSGTSGAWRSMQWTT